MLDEGVQGEPLCWTHVQIHSPVGSTTLKEIEHQNDCEPACTQTCLQLATTFPSLCNIICSDIVPGRCFIQTTMCQALESQHND